MGSVIVSNGTKLEVKDNGTVLINDKKVTEVDKVSGWDAGILVILGAIAGSGITMTILYLFSIFSEI